VIDKKAEGISLNLEHEDEGYAEAEEKLKIYARAFLGEVKVQPA
jgi:predicted membrane protein